MTPRHFGRFNVERSWLRPLATFESTGTCSRGSMSPSPYAARRWWWQVASRRNKFTAFAQRPNSCDSCCPLRDPWRSRIKDAWRSLNSADIRPLNCRRSTFLKNARTASSVPFLERRKAVAPTEALATRFCISARGTRIPDCSFAVIDPRSEGIGWVSAGNCTTLHLRTPPLESTWSRFLPSWIGAPAGAM